MHDAEADSHFVSDCVASEVNTIAVPCCSILEPGIAAHKANSVAAGVNVTENPGIIEYQTGFGCRTQADTHGFNGVGIGDLGKNESGFAGFDNRDVAKVVPCDSTA